MLKGGNTRGLSTIVATLLIILLTLVAVGIVWFVLRDLISNNSELAKTKSDFFSESVQISNLKMNGGLINLSLTKIGGTIKIKTEGGQKTETTIAKEDIISVVDLSGSMRSCHGVSQACCSTNLRGGTYDSGNCDNLNVNNQSNCVSACGGTWVDRLSAVQEANKELINVLFQSEGSRVGLVGYNASAVNSASLDLTDNLTQLNNKIDSWQSKGGTCICCGINAAFDKLQQQSSDDRMKKIIVMSDGAANVRCLEQNTPNATQDSIQASCDAKNGLANLTVYSIGLGEDVNEETLISISSCGSGKYFSAINVSELIDVYKQAVEDTKTTYESPTKFSYLYIVFYSNTSSDTEKILEIPDVLITKTYEFNITGKLDGAVTKIEIYPVIVTDSGKEVIGPVSDVWRAG